MGKQWNQVISQQKSRTQNKKEGSGSKNFIKLRNVFLNQLSGVNKRPVKQQPHADTWNTVRTSVTRPQIRLLIPQQMVVRAPVNLFLPARCAWAAVRGRRGRRTRSLRRPADRRPVCLSGRRDAPSPRRWAPTRPPRIGRGPTGAWSAAGSSAAWPATSTGSATRVVRYRFFIQTSIFSNGNGGVGPRGQRKSRATSLLTYWETLFEVLR